MRFLPADDLNPTVIFKQFLPLLYISSSNNPQPHALREHLLAGDIDELHILTTSGCEPRHTIDHTERGCPSA